MSNDFAHLRKPLMPNLLSQPLPVFTITNHLRSSHSLSSSEVSHFQSLYLDVRLEIERISTAIDMQDLVLQESLLNYKSLL